MQLLKLLHDSMRRRMGEVQETAAKQVTTNLSGKQKAFVILYAMSWIVAIGFSWAYWHEMNWMLKSLVVVAEIFLLPDMDAIRSVFRKLPNI